MPVNFDGLQAFFMAQLLTHKDWFNSLNHSQLFPAFVSLASSGTGRSLVHSLMVKDHFEALQFALSNARAKEPVTVGLIQNIAGMVLKSIGKIYNTPLGNIDSSKGAFRKGNVNARGSYLANMIK